jgi:hypothetical protein
MVERRVTRGGPYGPQGQSAGHHANGYAPSNDYGRYAAGDGARRGRDDHRQHEAGRDKPDDGAQGRHGQTGARHQRRARHAADPKTYPCHAASVCVSHLKIQTPRDGSQQLSPASAIWSSAQDLTTDRL